MSKKQSINITPLDKLLVISTNGKEGRIKFTEGKHYPVLFLADGYPVIKSDRQGHENIKLKSTDSSTEYDFYFQKMLGDICAYQANFVVIKADNAFYDGNENETVLVYSDGFGGLSIIEASTEVKDYCQSVTSSEFFKELQPLPQGLMQIELMWVAETDNHSEPSLLPQFISCDQINSKAE